MDKEGNVKEVGTNKAQVRKKDDSLVKRKRGGEKEEEKALGKGKEINIEAQKERKEEDGSSKTTITLDAKGRKNTWRNFHSGTAKMGLVREHIHLKVLEERDGKIQLEELIDPTLVILSDNMKEMGMNLLNNAHNNLVDNFWSIKWIFHEIEEIKFRTQGKEKMKGGDENVILNKMDTRVSESEKMVERRESSFHSLVNYNLNIIKDLNDNIIQLHSMMEESKKGKEDKLLMKMILCGLRA